MTVKEVAQHWRVNPRTVFRWVKKQKLKPVRLGGTLRFKRGDVNNKND